MTPLLLRLLLLLLLLITPISAQSGPGPSDTQTSFRPSVAVVIGIFSIMFSLTFLLLMYAKFCHSVAYDFFNRGGGADPAAAVTFAPGGPHRTLSGMDKAVIESLPFFRFSNLKGSRRGLECAVCLSVFDDAEVLRLLPKCKHAFHIGCVDKWLESHSTCPLCRHRVDPQDANPFNYSTSTRFLLNSDSEGRRSRDPELELFVEREPDDVHQIGSARKNDVPISNEMHKFKHKIIVSDVVFKSRWSDLNSSDLVSLSSDMLNVASSKRFTKRLADNKESEISDSSLITPGRRSMSEMANVSRFLRSKNAPSESVADEKVRMMWLPIARRTVQWFAGRERRGEVISENDHNRADSNV